MKGSAARALDVRDRPFDRFLFIEKNPERSISLRALEEKHPDRNIDVFTGDANAELPKFCKSMGNLDRAVVFLDPFATEVDWETIEAISKTKKIDCWILFPLMAIARMMPTGGSPTPQLASHLDRIFGEREHWQSIYQESPQLSFFPGDQMHERQAGSDQIASLYRARLASTFEKVAPTARTFKNSRNAPMFELFFAACNPVGAKTAVRIAGHILEQM